MSNVIADFFKAIAGVGKASKEKQVFSEKQKERNVAFFAAMEKRGYKFAIEEKTLANGKIVSYDTDTKTAMMLEGDDFRYLDAGDYDLSDGTKLRVEDAVAGMAEVTEEVEAELATEPEADAKMGSYTLADGRTIEVGMAGEPVVIDGEMATAGEYTTGDGIVIRVDEGGMLIEQLSKMTAESLPMATAAFAEVEKLKAEIVKMKAVETAQRTELEKLSAKTVDPRPKQTNEPAPASNVEEFANKFQKFLHAKR